jgi:hypothetical protein
MSRVVIPRSGATPVAFPHRRVLRFTWATGSQCVQEEFAASWGGVTHRRLVLEVPTPLR